MLPLDPLVVAARIVTPRYFYGWGLTPAVNSVWSVDRSLADRLADGLGLLETDRPS